MRWGHKAIFCHFLREEKREREEIYSLSLTRCPMWKLICWGFRKEFWDLRAGKKTDGMIHKRIRERIQNTFRITRHCPLPPLASRKPGDGLNFPVSGLSWSVAWVWLWCPIGQVVRRIQWRKSESVSLSVVSDSAIPWTVVHQAPPSKESSSKNTSPGDLPDPGIEPRCSALQPDSSPSEPPGKPHTIRRPCAM